MKRETTHAELLTQYGSSLSANPFARSFGTGVHTAVRQLAWADRVLSGLPAYAPTKADWTLRLCKWIDMEYFVS